MTGKLITRFALPFTDPLFRSSYIPVIPNGWDAILISLAGHGVGLHELSLSFIKAGSSLIG